MNPPAIQILDNFDSLRDLLVQQGLTEQASEAADVFGTLAWFDNLAACGLVASSQGAVASQWWVAGDVGAGPAVCLPVLSGQKLTGLSNYYSSLFAPLVWPAPGTEALPEVSEV
ncbi:MAG TPA: hypothetical protein VIM63_12400, partial [Rhodoferax sp.]